MNKEKVRIIALRFLANGISILEDIEDLKETNIYRKEVKFYGNKFVEELEKLIVPIEKQLHENGEIELVNKMQDLTQELNETILKHFTSGE